MVSNYWTAEGIPDQTGKVAIVTGANSGIGFSTAKALLKKGMKVILACRSQEKGEHARKSLLESFPMAAVDFILLDLSDLASVHAFASTFSSLFGSLDLLINNAGLMAIPYRQTTDGFEMQFGVNHLGHFALTGLLLDHLLAADNGRVVTISSSMHWIGRVDFDDLNSEKSYNKWAAYGQSKLANLLFAYELQRRLDENGCRPISLVCHPGYAATNLQSKGPEMSNNFLLAKIMKFSNRLIAQSSDMGSLPTLFAATSPDVNGCDFIGPASWMGQRGYPRKVRSSADSYDQIQAKRLWHVSEEMTGVHYPFKFR